MPTLWTCAQQSLPPHNGKGCPLHGHGPLFDLVLLQAAFEKGDRNCVSSHLGLLARISFLVGPPMVGAIFNEVGQDWAKRFRDHPRTYSGLSLGKLSSKLGPEFLDWYAKVYGEQSKSVHATDFPKHAVYSKSEGRFLARWFPSIDEVQKLVGYNGLMLWCCLELLNKQFQFAVNTDADLQVFLPILARIVGSC